MHLSKVSFIQIKECSEQSADLVSKVKQGVRDLCGELTLPRLHARILAQDLQQNTNKSIEPQKPTSTSRNRAAQIRANN
mgnify:CR=1 FL=1